MLDDAPIVVTIPRTERQDTYVAYQVVVQRGECKMWQQ